MGVVIRRYLDILIIIITFPYSSCIALFGGGGGAAASLLLCSFLKYFLYFKLMEVVFSLRSILNLPIFLCRGF